MDKLKTTYRIRGEEMRLADPDHFYEWARENGGESGSFERVVERYAEEFPSRLTPA